MKALIAATAVAVALVLAPTAASATTAPIAGPRTYTYKPAQTCQSGYTVVVRNGNKVTAYVGMACPTTR